MQTIATLSLGARPEATREAAAWLEDIAASHPDWPPARVFALTLCVDEALSNIIMHAGLDAESDTSITLTLKADASHLIVDIRDQGVAFDPTLRPSPPLVSELSEARPGGHGLRLMRHYLKRIEYTREAGHNCLRLVLERDLPEAP